jgi:tripartite-type tricarboxylate transporter receptor subunit TctC
MGLLALVGGVWTTPPGLKELFMVKKLFLTVALACGTIAAQAQSFPANPIRLVIPFPPGGGTDILSRLVATKLGEVEKWNLIPDNRPGAGGTIGIAEAARAMPNGYTIVMGQKDNMAVAPWLYKGLSFEPTRDFSAVAHIAYTPVVIVTAKNSRFQSLADVVAAARSAPDSVTYGSPGNGTTIHLAGESFNNAANIKMRHIPYKGSNAAMMDVLGGTVDLAVSSVPSALSQIKAGKVRALAVTSTARSTSLPDVPTVAESGYKGFNVNTWYGLFMPAKTPKEIVEKVNGAVNKLLQKPEIMEAIYAQGAEPQAMSPQQFSSLLQKDHADAKDIVLRAGLKME